MKKKNLYILMFSLILVGIAYLAGVKFLNLGKTNEQPVTQALNTVDFILDWTPNTNHTGLYVAQAKGYFEEEGIALDIKLPPEGSTTDMIINGQAPLGISFQDSLAIKLSKGAPVTAVAAVIDENTSGILSVKKANILEPKDLEHKKYGTWDDPMEQAMIATVMKKQNASFDALTLVPNTDFNSIVSLNNGLFEAAWIFYGWDGVMAEHQKLDTNYFYFKDYAPELNYYTPIIIANNDYLKNHSEEAKKVMRAIKKGYQYAIEHPKEAAEILIQKVPELKEDSAFVLKSQDYLSKHYAPQGKAHWGKIDAVRWNAFFKWAKENQLLEQAIEENKGFDNTYLGE